MTRFVPALGFLLVLLVPTLVAADLALKFTVGLPVGSDGRTDITDFRGQPVLFAWYKNGGYGMDAAVTAVKLQKKYGGKGLVVILIDSEPSREDAWAKSHAFLLSRFPGFNAWSSAGIQVPGASASYREGAGVALVGVDGTMVLKGANRALGNKLDKAVAAEIRKMTTGFGKNPTARKVRALAFGKHDLAGAAALAKGEDDEVAQALRDIETRYKSLRESVEYFASLGLYRNAEARARELSASVKGHAKWAPAVERLIKRIASEATAEDRARERTLDRFQRALARGKVSAGLVRKIRRFAEQCAKAKQSSAAKRCATLAAAIAAR